MSRGIVRLVGAALIVVTMIGSPPALAQDDNSWCPVVIDHLLPSVIGVFTEEIDKRAVVIEPDMLIVWETIRSVADMDSENLIRRAYVAMMCDFMITALDRDNEDVPEGAGLYFLGLVLDEIFRVPTAE